MGEAMSLGGVRPSDMAAHRALARAVLDEVPPCLGSPLPTSDDPDDRALAARGFCPGCGVRALCAAAGEGEPWGVWGGTDKDPRKRARSR